MCGKGRHLTLATMHICCFGPANRRSPYIRLRLMRVLAGRNKFPSLVALTMQLSWALLLQSCVASTTEGADTIVVRTARHRAAALRATFRTRIGFDAAEFWATGSVARAQMMRMLLEIQVRQDQTNRARAQRLPASHRALPRHAVHTWQSRSYHRPRCKRIGQGGLQALPPP